VVAKCEYRVSDIVVEKTSGSLRLHFLGGHGLEKRRAPGGEVVIGAGVISGIRDTGGG